MSTQGDNLRKLIATHQRRLQLLLEKKALLGISVDPATLIEIEDIEAEIEKLQIDLRSDNSSMVTDALRPLSIGDYVNRRYKILKYMGQNKWKIVYLAKDMFINRDCILTQLCHYDPAVKSLVEGEMRVLHSLLHPGLPRILDFLEDSTSFFSVTEFVEGATLEDVLNASPDIGISEDCVLNWAAQLCDALSYLHRKNPPIIHRNIKPSSIILTDTVQNKVKLVGFGIARFFRSGLLRDEEIIGAPGFAPPEQYGKAQTDIRSDIYCLGATLYHLLTKHYAHPFDEFPDLISLNPKISEQTNDSIMRALEWEPEKRFQSADEMKMALTSLK